MTIFQFALSPYEEWQQLAWAGALIITVDRSRAQHRCARLLGRREDR